METKMEWEQIFSLLRRETESVILPAVSEVSEDTHSPFRILISTVISLRTKDDVTRAASKRLFECAGTPEQMLRLPAAKIGELIYPAGFYNRKSEQILKICDILINNYNGKVPNTEKDLSALPGVGIKTANLVLGLGYNIPAICVDTHVHRIANRVGWIKTATPEKTEKALRKILPIEYWIEINDLLVKYGQLKCKPISPICSQCPIIHLCAQKGIEKHR